MRPACLWVPPAPIFSATEPLRWRRPRGDVSSGAMDIEGVATARPATGTLELFPDAGDVAMR
jgi:hypothetical protein